MPPISRLILPPRELASCVAGCLYRDTRGIDLTDQERLNYFPASPLFAASVMLTGKVHLAETLVPLEDIKRMPVAPKHFCAPPKNSPHMSWSVGALEGITVVFYPDAWQLLGGKRDGSPPDSVSCAMKLFEHSSLACSWPLFCNAMALAWSAAQRNDGTDRWGGSTHIRNWTYHLMGKAAHTGTGRSLRSMQRRVKRWTGLDIQTLDFFGKIEDLHQLATQEPNSTAVELAAGAGFADQSHMGRVLKRATGFSPVQLNQRIADDEAFWCYRLLGERF